MEEEYGLGAIHTGRSQVGIERMPTEAVELRELVQRLATSDLWCEGPHVESDEEYPRDGYEETSVGRKRKWSFSSSICRLFHLDGEGEAHGVGLKRSWSTKGREVARSVGKALRKAVKIV